MTVATLRNNGRPLLSVVNAGVLDHPGHGRQVVGFVARGGAAKLAHVRARKHVSVLARRGWQWVCAEGDAELIGPDDTHDAVSPAELPALLRSIFVAAGGTHDDWEEFDRVMRDEARCAVLLEPTRVYSNPG